MCFSNTLMASESGSEYSETESSNSINENTLQNLRDLRAAILKNYLENMKLALEYEIRDYEKYSVVLNVKETMIFDDDSEDIGIREDLELLGIK